MLALFAEIEHDLVVARTKGGLAAARAKGRQLGRGVGNSERLDALAAAVEHPWDDLPRFLLKGDGALTLFPEQLLEFRKD